MAFTGSPVVTQLNDNELRITGVSLDHSAVGTIGLNGASGGAPDITLPATFRASAYTYQGNPVGLQDSVDAVVNMVSAGPLTNLMPSISKTGTTVADFRISITNTNTTDNTQTLEILITITRPQSVAPARLS